MAISKSNDSDCFLKFEDDAIIYRINSPLILEASAGSGKTTLLVERYLAILIYLLTSKDQLNNSTLIETVNSIVALTFTRKAAGEMQERIREKIERCFTADYLRTVINLLQKYNQNFTPSNIDRRIDQILLYRDALFNSLAFAPISTIHSFGLKLLRMYPVETEIDPTIAIEEDSLEEHLSIVIKKAKQQVLHNLIVAKDKDLTFLVENLGFDNEKSNNVKSYIDELLKKILEVGMENFEQALNNSNYLDLEKEYENLKGGDIDKFFWNHLAPLIQNLQDSLDKAKEVKKGNLPKKLETLDKTLEKLNLDVMNHLFTFDLEAHFDSEPKGEELKTAYDAVKRASEKVLFRLHQFIMPALFKFVSQIYNEYRLQMFQRKQISFADIEFYLFRALKTRPDFRQMVQSSIRYILVDEYQDTSNIQKDIFDLIIRDKSESLTDRPPIIPFIVGDPKQSIYSFRNANIEIFKRTVEEFREAYGTESYSYISRNYRSTPDLIRSFNLIFSEIFSKNHIDKIEYRDQVPIKVDENLPGTSLNFIPAIGEQVDESFAFASKQAVTLIRDLVENNGYRPGDFMILVRKKSKMKLLNRELENLPPSIPYVRLDVTNLLHQKEVKDLLIYLRALDNPNSDYFFFPLLKSPFMRMDDSTILYYSFQAQKLRQSSLNGSNRQHSTESSLYQVISQTNTPEIRQFQNFFNLKNRMNIPELLEKILYETGYFAYLNTLPHRKEAVTNVLTFIKAIRQIQSVDKYDLTSLLYAIAFYGIELPQPQIVGEKSDVVRVMTVHSAKGLEARVVIYLATASQNNPSKLYLDTSSSPPTIGFNIDGKDLNYVKLEEKIKSKQNDEEKRLAYVAFTRAREKFYYIGVLEKKNTKKDGWSEIFNLSQPLISKYKGDIKLPQTELVEPTEHSVETENADVNKQVEFLLDKLPQINLRIYPDVITITQLLDIEFLPAAFKNKYLVKSYPIDESLNKISEEEGLLMLQETNSDIGSYLHRVFQFADSQNYEKYIEQTLPQENETLRQARDLIFEAAQNYFLSPFYQEIHQQIQQIYNEWEINFRLNTGELSVIIKGSIDKYLTYQNNTGAIVDYKLSVNPSHQERYFRQLNYYGYLLNQMGYSVNRLYLYNIKEHSVIPVKMNLKISGEKLSENALKIVEQFTSANLQSIP